jgi:competence protein ComEC
MCAAGVTRQFVVKTCLLLMAGGLAAQHTTVLLSYDLLCLSLLASAAALVHRRARPAALFVIGFALFMLDGAGIVGKRLDDRYAGDSMLVRLRVADFPRRNGSNVTMTMVPLDDPRVPPRVRLSWFEPLVMPRIGETWELEVRLRTPRGSLNPGGFDVETWLFRERFHATGYVVEGKRNRLLWSGGASPVDAFRARFVARARAATGSPETAAVLAAIGVGARHHVSRPQWDRFAATGTSHLMAISGLHVGLAAVAGFGLGFGLAVAVPGRRNHYLAAVLLGVLVAGAYAVVSGFGVPARRAIVMLLVAGICVARRRQVDPAITVALAAIVVFVTDPVSTLTPGFHLSFAAVVVLLWLARRRGATGGRVSGPVRQLVVMQIFLMFGLAPLTATMFARFAVLATPVNLLAVPVFSFVTVPLTLAAGFAGDILEPVSISLLRLAGSSVSLVDAVIRCAAGLPLADGTIAGLEGIAWLLVALPLTWVVLPRSWPARHVATLGLIALLAWKPPPPPADCFDAWVLDVGQGLAVGLQTSQGFVLYDTGMRWRSGGSAAEQVILPFLASRGLGRISHLVVSHADLDHSGGVEALLREVEVDRIVTGEPLPGIDTRQCRRGGHWDLGGIGFEILHPPGQGDYEGNDASCVLRVAAGPHALLLTGDVERRAERQLLPAEQRLSADVVVVPHHGSRTSSSPAFVEAVAPSLAVVSAGYANRWGFPVPLVAERWKSAGAAMRTTASDGAVFMRICADDGIVDLASERQRRRRFWHDES